MTGATATTPSLGRRVLALMGPMVVASVMGQAIAQTDLWVISTLGEQAVAAAAVPQRLLLLDSITAMAMGPVVGLSVAGAVSAHARRRAVQGGLVGATAAGLLIAAVGLAVLPFLVDTLVAAPAVRDHTRSALWWLLIATPVRLAQFVGAMALFALRRSRPSSPCTPSPSSPTPRSTCSSSTDSDSASPAPTPPPPSSPPSNAPSPYGCCVITSPSPSGSATAHAGCARWRAACSPSGDTCSR